MVVSERDKWKNRRAMAWVSLVASLLFPLLLLYTENTQLGAIAGAFYLFTGAVVGSYIGFALWMINGARCLLVAKIVKK